MSNPFEDAMSRRSDEELVGIVGAHRGDYRPEAITAAEAELALRNLPVAFVESVTQEIRHERDELDERKDIPLGMQHKVMFLLLPVFVLGWLPSYAMARWSYMDKGYIRKYEDAKRWMMFGVLGYVGLFVLMALYMMF